MGCNGSKSAAAAGDDPHAFKRSESFEANLVELHDNVTEIDHLYETNRRLGEGGFSYVSLATERSTGRHVAIKTIHKSSFAEQHQLMNEIDVMRHLEHPNIVRLCKCGFILLG